MACRENICFNSLECNWSQWSNETVKQCPLCGGNVINQSDELLYEYMHESPSGDDENQGDE